MTTIIKWKKHSAILQEGEEYINKRATKEIKSLKTGWKSFDKMGLNGIEWNTLLVLCARPGIGKTLLVSSLSRQLQECNPGEDFYVLHFQFEMLGRNIAVREFAAALQKDIRYLLSAEDDGMPEVSKEDLLKLTQYSKEQDNRKEYIIDTPLTVYEMAKTIEAFYNHFKKPFIATLDHTLLVKQSNNEKDYIEKLTNLAEMMKDTKNLYPMSWIALSQLKRELDSAERQIPGKMSNFPTPEDIFGGDKMMHSADVVIAYNRPAKYYLKYYGPDKFIIDNKYLIAAHVLKNRNNADTGIQWYIADYPTMRFIETKEPQKKDG